MFQLGQSVTTALVNIVVSTVQIPCVSVLLEKPLTTMARSVTVGDLSGCM